MAKASKKPGITACIITAREEPFAELTLSSVFPVVDDIIVVGDPCKDLRRVLRDYNARLFWRDWDGLYGKARNKALKEVWTDRAFTIDMDEFLEKGDAFRSMGKDVYDVRMRHFIWSLAWEDASLPEHWGLRRFFKVEGSFYDRDFHEFTCNENWKTIGREEYPVIWHLGYLKGLDKVREKYVMNVTRPDKHFNKEFMDQWVRSHVLGLYPVKPVNPDEIPREIREWFYCL